MNIGRYELRGTMGQGGWSTVYLAWDTRLRREVALKALPDQHRHDEALRRRLVEEGNLLARLRHPNIVVVHDVEDHGDGPFYTMELVEGTSAAQLALAGHGLPLDQVISIVNGIAAALDYLHGCGIVHADVKPGNTLLDRSGRVILIDFGLAHPIGDASGHGVSGTPPYIAPEVVLGEPSGPPADIYALGSMTFALLAGRPPFPGEDGAMLSALVNDVPPPLHMFRPDLPNALSAVVAMTLARSPWQRPARAGLFAAGVAAASRQPPSMPQAVRPVTGQWPGSIVAGPTTITPPGRWDDRPTLNGEQVAPAISAPAAAMPPPSPLPAYGSSYPESRGARTPQIPPAQSMQLPPPPASVHPSLGARLRAIGVRLRPARPTRSSQQLPPSTATALPSAPSAGHLPPRAPTPPPDEDRAGIQLSSTVFAPAMVAPEETFLIQVFAHLPESGPEAAALAAEFDEAARRRGYADMTSRISVGERLMFALNLPGISIDNPVQFMFWMNHTQSVQFGATVPADHAPATVIGTVTISRENVPVGHIKFKLTVRNAADTTTGTTRQPVGEGMHVYRRAFISYASSDRREVLKRTQMLERMKIEFFQDVLNLEPGDRWEQELYRHIDDCDLFLLFWSTAAKQSAWVMKEVNYALSRKGGDETAPPEVLPVIIEGPPLVPPPPELAHLHFNDRLLYLMQ